MEAETFSQEETDDREGSSPKRPRLKPVGDEACRAVASACRAIAAERRPERRRERRPVTSLRLKTAAQKETKQKKLEPLLALARTRKLSGLLNLYSCSAPPASDVGVRGYNFSDLSRSGIVMPVNSWVVASASESGKTGLPGDQSSKLSPRLAGNGRSGSRTRGSASLPGSWSQCMRKIERRLSTLTPPKTDLRPA